MNRRKKYRFFVICCLALDLLAIFWLGYKYLDRKIPDEIQISRDSGESTEDVTEVLSAPLVTFEKAVTVSQDGGYILPCRLLGYIPFKEVKVTPVDEQEIYVSGSTIGIYMETEGVLVIDTGEIEDQNGEMKEPAKNLVRQGDYIVSFNGEKISTKRELINDIAGLDGEEVTLEVKREGESVPVSVTPVKDTKGDYKLGIWVRDDTQGIGTLTYVDQNGRYGALGHGISDSDTGDLVETSGGNLYNTQILGIEKGKIGTPGMLSGVIYYGPKSEIGTVAENTDYGIFGTVNQTFLKEHRTDSMEAARRQEVKTGPALVRTSISGQVKDYSVEIQRIDMTGNKKNKSLVIKITDPELLNLTGGIIQGTSGSPLIQNGKIIGAITHVFVQDPTRGYGILIEDMISH